MKKLIYILSFAILAIIACKKKDDAVKVNKFQFTYRTGEKITPDFGRISAGWEDASNTSWKVTIKNAITNTKSVDTTIEKLFNKNIRLDTLYVIDVVGIQDTSSNGNFNVRIGTMGDVTIRP
jgi:hypothetical protein